MAIIPDTTDWTWVLERACPDCGFDPALFRLSDLPRQLHDTTMVLAEVLRRPDVAQRPTSDVWSPLEYACHVRDVHRIFAERLTAMLREEAPRFANWDQDATAVDEAYGEQDPDVVAVDLIEAAGTVAGLYASVSAGSAERVGLRSDGMEFTVTTLGAYHLHDVVHHVNDVGAS